MLYHVLLLVLLLLIFIQLAPVQTALLFGAVFASTIVNYIMHHMWKKYPKISDHYKIIISGIVSGLTGFYCGYFIGQKLEEYRKW